jgi:hypothetical protein
MATCKDCGVEVTFMQNWREQWVVIEVEPPEQRRESYVEVEMEVFVSVFRHECPVRAKAKRERAANFSLRSK